MLLSPGFTLHVPPSLAIYQRHPYSSNILSSLHRQPLMTHVPPSLAIYQLHPCSSNILSSLRRQPLMIHVPPSLAIYHLHPCTTNILSSLYRQPLITHVPPSLAKLIPPKATGSPSQSFPVHFTMQYSRLFKVLVAFFSTDADQVFKVIINAFFSGSCSVHLTVLPSPLVHK